MSPNATDPASPNDPGADNRANNRADGRNARIAKFHHAMGIGHFTEALALTVTLTDQDIGDLELASLRRLCLARMGRIAEAVDLGARIAQHSQNVEDWFRYAQLANKLGRGAEALPWALRALAAAPFNPRHVEAVTHAALLLPEGPGIAIDRLRGLQLPGPSLTSGWRGHGLLAPQRLPHYVPYDSDHHAHMGWVLQLRQTIPDILPAGAWFGGGGLADVLPMAAAIQRRFQALPHVEASHAAEYLAARVSCLLIPSGDWPLEFVSTSPLTLGQRPWVYWFDILPALFNPFTSIDDIHLDAHSPWYQIVKLLLEDPACRAICSHYPQSRGYVGEFFQSRVIAAKTHHINACDLGATSSPPPSPPRPDDRVTLLFTSSRKQQDAGFYRRGGVDVLNGFDYLAQRIPNLHLILRGTLPATLSERLVSLVQEHPRIRWVPGFLDEEQHRVLMAEADIFLMPGPILFRNGITEALRLGIVPVLGDPPGIDEVVTHGVNAVIVPGRRHRMRVTPEVPELSANLLELLRATDQPADPVFFNAYVQALEELIVSPHRRADLSRAGMLTPQASPADLETFERVIAQASDAH